MKSSFFSKVASQLSKPEFKEFKVEILNPLLQQFTGRSLNPSKLNEMASQLMGGDNSNVISKVMKATSPEEIKDAYIAQVASLNQQDQFNWMPKSSLLPLFEFTINKEVVVMGVDIHCESYGGNNITLDIYINAPDIDEENTTNLASLNANGGDNLTSLSRLYSHVDEQVIENILRDFGSGERIVKSGIPSVITNMYGIKKSNFSNFSNYSDLADYLNTVLTMVSSDLNMRLAAKGKARSIQRTATFTTTLA